MRFGHSLVLAGSLCLALPSACSNEGKTPACSSFPEPYDVRTERGRLNAREAMAAAAEDGCLTLPAGFDDAEGGAGGTDAGAGGAESGAGGSAGPSGGVGAEGGAPADAGGAGASAEAGAAGASQ